MGLALQVSLARRADAPRIADMSRQFIEQGLRWRWTEHRLLSAMADPATDVIVLRDGGAVAGFAVMQYADWHAHLCLLAVDPVRRRQGLATQLLDWLECCADTAAVASLRLEARADNPPALAFYQRRGYAATGTIAGYYDGVIAAVRLEKRLWPVRGPLAPPTDALSRAAAMPPPAR